MTLPENIREATESVIDGWYPEGRIDWDDALDRIEAMADVDLGTDLLSPVIKDIKAYARRYRSEKG